MPTVPRISQAPLPGVEISGGTPAAPPDAAFGGGAGNASAGLDLSPLVREATSIAEKQQATSREAALDASRLSVGQLRQGLVTQYQSLRGLDAPAQQENYRAQFADGVKQIRDSIGDDAVRQAFDHTTVDDTLSFDEAVARHSLDQQQQADHATYLGSRELLFNDVTAQAGDDVAVDATLKRLNALTSDYGSRTGQPQPMIDADIARDRSNVRAQVLDTMTARGDIGAQAYFDAHKDEMIGPQRIDAEKAVHEVTVRAASQRAGDLIMFGHKTFPTFADAMEEVRAIQDPEVRDRTDIRVRQGFADKRAAEHDARDDNMIKAGDAIDASGGDIHAIPANDWAAFEPAQKAELDRYASGVRGGESVATDWTLYNDLVTKATTKATQPDFLQTNLTDYLSRLAPAQRKELIDLQGQLRSRDATEASKAAQQLGQIRTTNQVVTDGLHAIGIGTNPKRRAQDAPVINTVFGTVTQQIGDLQDREQRKATTAEVQAIVDETLTKHVVSTPGMFYGRNQTSKRLFEMTPDDSLVLSPSDIPARDRPPLDQWLRDHGAAPTDANRVGAYRAYLQTLGRRGPQ